MKAEIIIYYVGGDLSLQMNKYELTAAMDKVLCISIFMKTVFHWFDELLRTPEPIY